MAKASHPHGTDIVIDCTGDSALLEFGASLVRFGGSFVLAGYCGGSAASIRPDKIHERNVRVLGAGNNSGFTETALLTAGDDVIRTDTMITHRFGLEEYRTALSAELIARGDFIKGIFVLGAAGTSDVAGTVRQVRPGWSAAARFFATPAATLCSAGQSETPGGVFQRSTSVAG